MKYSVWSEQADRVLETEDPRQAAEIEANRRAAQIARAGLSLINTRRPPTDQELNWWVSTEVSLWRTTYGVPSRPLSDRERWGLGGTS